MALNSNQFTQSPTVGDLDLQFPGSVISVQVYASEASALVAGRAVKVVDSAGGVPKVTAIAANTDKVAGFIVRNLKDQDFPAGSRLELAQFGSVMYMTASGAISREGEVEYDYSTGKVGAAAGVNPVVGIAVDKAAADGDVIRVQIMAPEAVDARTVFSVRNTVTLAEINAGKVIVPAVTGKKVRVLNYIARVSGGFAATTSVDLQSSTTGTKVTALAVAGLTNGAVLQPTSSNTTLGAGFGADLEVSEGLKVANTGSAATTGTSITYTVTYQYVA